MSDLKLLRSKLMSLQQKPTGNRLSERNVVDIVQKLVEKYNLTLIFTLSGKEYLTPGRLVQDIVKEVKAEGRVSLLDLPNVLNASIDQIEAHAPMAVGKDLFLINGHLLSSEYVDNMCQEINLSLQEAGQVSLSELTMKYSIPMTFLKSEIEKRLQNTIHAQFSTNNVLVTDSYLQRHLGKLRGSLRAATKPLDLKHFDQSLLLSQVQTLISSGQVKGTLDGLVFTPIVYQAAIWDEVKSYFFVNRFIEHDYIKKRLQYLGSGDWKAICGKLEAGEFFADVYVSDELIGETKAKIVENMKGKSFADFFDLDMPGCFAEEDIEGLISEGIFVSSHYLYTEKALESAVGLLGQLIAALSEETKEVKGKKNPSLGIDTIIGELKKKKFLNAPLEFLEGFSEAVYSRVSHKIAENRENRSKPSEAAQDTFVQDFNYLFLCNKSIQIVHKTFPNIKPLQVHLSKTLANNLLNELLRIELIHHGFQVPAVKTNDRAKLISKLPDYLKIIFEKLGEKITAKELDGFISELLGNIKNIPIVTVKAVDKKSERNILHKLRTEVKIRLKKEVSGKNYVNIALLGAKYKLLESNLLIDLPGEKWALTLLSDLYSTQIGQDITTTLLRALSENAEKNILDEMVEELCSYLTLSS